MDNAPWLLTYLGISPYRENANNDDNFFLHNFYLHYFYIMILSLTQREFSSRLYNIYLSFFLKKYMHFYTYRTIWGYPLLEIVNTTIQKYLFVPIYVLGNFFSKIWRPIFIDFTLESTVYWTLDQAAATHIDDNVTSS